MESLQKQTNVVEHSSNILSPETMLGLGNLYDSNLERTEVTLNFYKKLYNLQILEKEYKVTKELFKYCQKRNFFINIIALNGNLIFLKRSFGENLKWELPGGSIRSKGKETFEEATSRIIDRDIPKIEMTELAPVAFIKKRYTYLNQEVSHYGLLVTGRVIKPSPSEIEKNEEIKGRFVEISNTHELSRLVKFEREQVELAYKFYKDIDIVHTDSIDNEISSVDRITKGIHFIHNKIIRVLFKPFSSVILKRKILQYIKKDFYVLDIACGDDDFVYKLAQHSKVCVGNDIAWNSIKRIADSIPSKHNIDNLYFTNHDACSLPYSIQFDFTLCKNILHHMNNVRELKDLLHSIKKVSRRILIVDPEDPQHSSVLSKLWHFYYRRLLKDQGDCFYSRDFLNNLLKEFFGDKIQMRRVWTIKGYFMFCYIDFDLIKTNNMVDHRIKALVFDLDGLLVNTEPLFLKSIKEVLRSRNITIEDNDYINNDLQNGTSFLKNLLVKGYIKDDNEANIILEEIYNNYKTSLKNGFETMPGAIETIRRLKSSYKLAIASSSKRQFIEYILSNLGLLNEFDVIISREDVRNIKPDPECLFRIASELKIDTNEIILVEDSWRGVKAAENAKIKIIVIPNELTKDFDYKNVLLLKNLSELSHEVINSL